ncbi:lamin tail domain-containing protein [Mangrovimonas aestuarii]|uniref:lamin tail domain-containing protein n=1 Tax=Mangrovimonas aestuarii TaxID=3018443 RepID=UPI002379748E|nr:lamin tail domain-containing protein [Mangrovimonas aestuarii]
MSTISFKFKIPAIFFVLSVFLSCSTDDVDPSLVEVGVSDTSLSETDGVVILTATLNAPAPKNISIPLTFEGSATLNEDYESSANSIEIDSGDSSGQILIMGVQDNMVEEIETIIIIVGENENFVSLTSFEINIDVLDADSDSDNDGVVDSEDECPDTPGPADNNGCPFLGFIINEVNYDPAPELDGDANGDGVREPNEDEFIEFFNSGPDLDISGYTISDAETLRHTFPTGTIVPSNSAIVVFGGGTPTGTFGGALVQTASEGLLNMNNAGDFVTVQDADGNVVVTFDVEVLSDNPNESYTRNPDITGEFVQHAGIDEANGALFSPGTKVDGTSF